MEKTDIKQKICYPGPNIYVAHSHPIPFTRSYVLLIHSNTIAMDSIHTILTVGLTHVLNTITILKLTINKRHEPVSLRYDDILIHTRAPQLSLSQATAFLHSLMMTPRYSSF